MSKDIDKTPYPECSYICMHPEYFGVGECRLVCPNKFYGGGYAKKEVRDER